MQKGGFAIPGVAGVGEKTAVGLLQGIGGLKAIYDNLDQATQGVREILLRNNVLSHGQTFVLTSGVPFSLKLPTNSLTIEEV